MAKKHGIKVVVWDLDHTLWHGILSENDEIQLREGVREILETLDQRGILLSVASKNSHDDAWAHLQALGLDHLFLYPQIHWDSKSESVRRIKEGINVGYDAIAFIDDQPFERDEVNFVHPDVMCCDVDIIPHLLEREEFMPRFITDESATRRKMYQDDILRNAEEQQAGNNQAFLAQLDMRFRIAPATVTDLQRIEELTVRTNQLNATGYTYSYEELAAMLESPRHHLYVAELIDKYGSYGKIGVAMAEDDGSTWNLKLLLMSCRVMSRGVGTVLLQFIMNEARRRNRKLTAEFRHTDRNRQMFITYRFAGFREDGEIDGGGVRLIHDLPAEIPYPAYIQTDFTSDRIPQ